MMSGPWLALACFTVLLILAVRAVGSSPSTSKQNEKSTKPHIVVILADDMGWNDVGFHGSNEIPTPNIDALAYNGVILNGHYTQALCTPSRSAFLTGKYPIHTGMQHLVILETEPWGLGLNETLMSQHFKRNGYDTHAIGKWHLGFFRKEYTPTYRGFDSHFGYWQGYQDYYQHTVRTTYGSEVGYDMRRDMTVAWDAKGQYSTDAFTQEALKIIKNHDADKPMFMYLAHLATHAGNPNDPLQAPDEEIAKFAHIADPERRIYAAMVSLLDKSVGDVVSALREKHMLENSIILFMSDNGAVTAGIHANQGSNYPFRGMKHSPWEGASRGVSAIWSPLIKHPQRISNHLMHLADWLPTLFSAAGLDTKELGQIDGLDVWKSISENATSPRSELVYNVDDLDDYAALRRGPWKYIHGTTIGGQYDGWYGSSGDDPSYSYDPEEIVKSKTASALTGVITSVQIKLKHSPDEKVNGSKFAEHLLSVEKIHKLRKDATVRCPRVNLDDLPPSAECRPLESPCLFNLQDDPCEQVNLAKERPMIVINLEDVLMKVREKIVKPRNVPGDPQADPKFWDDVWSPWKDDPEPSVFWTPLSIILLSTACVLFLLVLFASVWVALKKSKKSGFEKPSNGRLDDSTSTALHLEAEDKLFEVKET